MAGSPAKFTHLERKITQVAAFARRFLWFFNRLLLFGLVDFSALRIHCGCKRCPWFYPQMIKWEKSFDAIHHCTFVTGVYWDYNPLTNLANFLWHLSRGSWDFLGPEDFPEFQANPPWILPGQHLRQRVTNFYWAMKKKAPGCWWFIWG